MSNAILPPTLAVFAVGSTLVLHITTVTEMLIDNASFRACWRAFHSFVARWRAFHILPLVDNAFVTAGGRFIFCSTLQ